MKNIIMEIRKIKDRLTIINLKNLIVKIRFITTLKDNVNVDNI